VNPTDYWVELRLCDGGVLGAGFYVTRRYVLTADHCLRSLRESESDVVLVHADGTEATGQVCERRGDVDLALVRLVGRSFVRPPTPQACAKDDLWRTPNRPTPADPHLNGAVDEPSVKYDCEGGAELEALQLNTRVLLGSYKGYSGSAVERVGAEPALAGVLQEQYENRYDPKLGATNVLFAVTMREAIAAFEDYFDHHDGTCSAASESRPVKELSGHAAALQQVADWSTRGLLGPSAATTIQLEIARSMVEEFIPKGSS
jgi:hypothetical protein